MARRYPLPPNFDVYHKLALQQDGDSGSRGPPGSGRIFQILRKQTSAWKVRAHGTSAPNCVPHYSHLTEKAYVMDRRFVLFHDKCILVL
jgi:hypothetical protein